MSYARWEQRYVRPEPASRVTPRHRRRRDARSRRVRGLTRLAVFVLIVVVAIWVSVRVAVAVPDARAFDGRPYTVRAGDTLWTIALDNYSHDRDPRRVVYEIEQKNHLQGSTLYEGERIVLPYLE
jgi:hypothetical protein